MSAPSIARRLLALAGALTLVACSGSDPEGPPPSPALWEVTAPSGEKGWLFGTIHALPEPTEWRTPVLDAVLDEAGVLVVEIADLDDRSAAAEAFAAVSTSPGLPPLLARVPAEERADLARALDRGGLREGDFARTESWAAALLIANAAGENESGAGVDRALLAGGLPVVGLESFAEQFAIFDRLAEPEQAELLHQAAIDSTPEAEQVLANAWLTGDLAALERETAEGLPDPELRQALLTDRNRRWSGTITELVERGRRPLVAVGAGHMLGSEGLPALLTARGYRVRRLQ